MLSAFLLSFSKDNNRSLDWKEVILFTDKHAGTFEELNDWLEFYRTVDTNNDGKVTKTEYRTLMSKFSSSKLNFKLVSIIFRKTSCVPVSDFRIYTVYRGSTNVIPFF